MSNSQSPQSSSSPSSASSQIPLREERGKLANRDLPSRSRLRSILQNFWPWAAAVLSGWLLALCFPDADQGWLCWIALTPLIAAVFFCKSKRRLWLKQLALGYVAGLTFFWLTFDWLITVTDLGWFLLAFYLGLYLAFWSWFTGRVAAFFQMNFLSGRRNLALAFLCASAWTAQEWLRNWLFSGFGWNGLGVALHGNLALIQIVEFTGIGGLSFLIAFTNIIAVVTIRRFSQEIGKARIRPHYDFNLTIALIVIVFAYGVHQLRKPPVKSEPLRVAAVQANIAQEEKFDLTFEQKIFTRYKKLTETALALNPQLLVWPEAATPRGMFSDQANFRFVMQFLANRHFNFMLGTLDSDSHGFYNAAVLVNHSGFQEYDKIHLVPFGEYIPFRHSFPLFAWIAGGLVPDDFAAGKKCVVFTTKNPKIKIAPLICFEDTLGELTRRFILNGAQLIVNITNDGWFRHSQGADQHFANAIFRTVETRRPMIRCANTGVTCFINANGRVTQELEVANHETHEAGKSSSQISPTNGDHFIQGVLSGVVQVPLNGGLTFYVRHGELFSQIAALITLLTLLGFGFGAWRKKREPAEPKK